MSDMEEEVWRIWSRIIRSMLLAEDNLHSILKSGINLNSDALESAGFYGESSIVNRAQLCIDTLLQVVIAILSPPSPLLYGQVIMYSHIAKVAADCTDDLRSAVEYPVMTNNNYDLELLSLNINYYADLMNDLRLAVSASSKNGISSILSNDFVTEKVRRSLMDRFVNAANPVYAKTAFERQTLLMNALLQSMNPPKSSEESLTDDNDINVILLDLYDTFTVLKREYDQYEYKTIQQDRSVLRSRITLNPNDMLLASTQPLPSQSSERQSSVEIIDRQRMKKFKQPIIASDYASLYGILASASQMSNIVSSIGNAMNDIEEIRIDENKKGEEKDFTFELQYNQLHHNILYELVYIEQIFRHTKYVVSRFFKHPSGILSAYDKVMHLCVVALTLTLRLLVAMNVKRTDPAYPQVLINDMDTLGRSILYILSYLNIISNQVHVQRLDPNAKFIAGINEAIKSYPDIPSSPPDIVSIVESFVGRNDNADLPDKLSNRSNEMMALALGEYQKQSSALIDFNYNRKEKSSVGSKSPSNLRRIIFTGTSIAERSSFAQPLLVVGLDAAAGELGPSTVGRVASTFASPLVSRISSNPAVNIFAPPALSLAANYAITGSINTGTMVNTVLSLFVPAAKWAYNKVTK